MDEAQTVSFPLPIPGRIWVRVRPMTQYGRPLRIVEVSADKSMVTVEHPAKEDFEIVRMTWLLEKCTPTEATEFPFIVEPVQA